MDENIEDELRYIERKKLLLSKCADFIEYKLNTKCFTEEEQKAILKFTDKLENEIKKDQQRIENKNALYNDSIKAVESTLTQRQQIIDEYFSDTDEDIMKIFAPHQKKLQNEYQAALNEFRRI